MHWQTQCNRVVINFVINLAWLLALDSPSLSLSPPVAIRTLKVKINRMRFWNRIRWTRIAVKPQKTFYNRTERIEWKWKLIYSIRLRIDNASNVEHRTEDKLLLNTTCSILFNINFWINYIHAVRRSMLALLALLMCSVWLAPPDKMPVEMTRFN